MGEHGERLARAENDIQHICTDRTSCAQRHADARKGLAEDVKALNADVVDLKQTLPEINRKLDAMKQASGNAFEWRRELLRAGVSLLIAMTVLLGAYWKALPEIRADVQETISASVTEAVQEASQ